MDGFQSLDTGRGVGWVGVCVVTVGVDAKLLTTPRDLDATSHKRSPEVLAAAGSSSLCYFKQLSVTSESKNSLFQTWCLSWFLSSQAQAFEQIFENVYQKYAHRWKGILTIEHPTMHCKEKAWALPKTWRKQIRFFFSILSSSSTFLRE